MILKFFSWVFGLDDFTVLQDVSRRQVGARSFGLLADIINFCHFEGLQDLLGIFPLSCSKSGPF